MPMPGVLPAEVFEKISDKVQSQVDLEQYLDFYRMRMFRQSLLCHKGGASAWKHRCRASGQPVCEYTRAAEGAVEPTDTAIAVFKSPRDRSSEHQPPADQSGDAPSHRLLAARRAVR